MSENLKRLLLDIRFYLLYFFILRLYGITDAPLESSHSWQQVFTNMIAIESVANQQHEFVIKNENKVWLNLESNYYFRQKRYAQHVLRRRQRMSSLQFQ